MGFLSFSKEKNDYFITISMIIMTRCRALHLITSRSLSILIANKRLSRRLDVPLLFMLVH